MDKGVILTYLADVKTLIRLCMFPGKAIEWLSQGCFHDVIAPDGLPKLA